MRAGACEVNEYATHHLSGYAEEVSAVLPADVFPVYKAEECLVDKGRSLKYVTRALSPHVAVSQTAKFSVNERDKFIEGRLISIAPGHK
jgi:hypothetical protein